MAKALRKTSDGFSVGFARLGRHGDGRGTPGQQVSDGDTVSVEADGNLGVRLLGVDAPERALTLPEVATEAVDRRPGEPFVPLTDERWERFLSDPFAGAELRLRRSLRDHLEPLLGPGSAANHARFAQAAKLALRGLVESDLEESGATRDEFRFFMAFASEVIDGYGRLLCYLNRDQPRPPRPPTYNERLLISGDVLPYFIWPNVDPFRVQPSLVAAVPRPGSAPPLADERAAVAAARTQGLGVWGGDEPLRLSPFELRFLARLAPPERWVIDLAARDDRLLAPQLYPRIDRPEDRLFVSEAFLPLFESRGWRPVRS
jgi:endonuclease YncB( thermonuclease family)